MTLPGPIGEPQAPPEGPRDDDGREPSDGDDGAPESRRPWKRAPRWAALVLVGGLALASVPLLSNVPEEREVHVDFGAEPIERLELVWFDEQEPVRQTVLSFDPAAPPHRVTTRLTLPDGRYRVELLVTRDGVKTETERHIELRSGVDEITIFVDPKRGP